MSPWSSPRSSTDVDNVGRAAAMTSRRPTMRSWRAPPSRKREGRGFDSAVLGRRARESKRQSIIVNDYDDRGGGWEESSGEDGSGEEDGRVCVWGVKGGGHQIMWHPSHLPLSHW